MYYCFSLICTLQDSILNQCIIVSVWYVHSFQRPINCTYADFSKGEEYVGRHMFLHQKRRLISSLLISVYNHHHWNIVESYSNPKLFSFHFMFTDDPKEKRGNVNIQTPGNEIRKQTQIKTARKTGRESTINRSRSGGECSIIFVYNQL